MRSELVHRHSPGPPCLPAPEFTQNTRRLSMALVAMEPASEDGATGDPDCDALRAGEVEAEGAE